MKQIISLLLIALLAIAVKAQVKVITKTIIKCPKTCDCPAIYKPVCGKSGLTHGNACLASCFKDQISKLGECNKCKGTKKITKNKCSNVRYGKTGKRKRCCTWIQQGTKVINKRCNYVGKTTYTKVISKCAWKKIAKGVKQRYCCIYTKYTTGKLVRHGKKRCKYIGSKITNTAKYHCTWKAFGKNGKRKYCCKKTKVCKGNKCSNVKRCNYRGAIYKKYRYTKCKWTQRKAQKCQQRKCCTYERSCARKGSKKAKCSTKVVKCQFVGHKIHRKTKVKCTVKTFGKTSKRKHCCKFKQIKKGGKVSYKQIKCYWSGPVKRTIRSTSCTWKKRNNGRQRLCCTVTKKCAGKKCAKFSRKCKWVGKLIVKKTSSKCKWIRPCKDGRQRRCCFSTKLCKNGKCKTRKKCKNVGPVYRRSRKTKCAWKYIKSGVKRVRCCTFEKNCIGNKCTQKKKKCKYVGSVLLVNNMKSHCVWKSHGKHCKKKYCCTYKQICRKNTNGKIIKCEKKNKKCKFVGNVIRNEKKRSCRVKVFGKNSKRKLCCEWTNYCNGKKCQPINSRCKWEGPVKTFNKKIKCQFVKRNNSCKQRRCCTYAEKCTIVKGKKKCSVVKGKCQFVGKKIYTSKKKCFNKIVGKNSRQRVCCKKVTNCKRGKCKTTNVCKAAGPVCITKRKSKCSYQRVGKYRQEKCCTFFVSCRGKKCKKYGRKCKFVGKKIKIGNNKTKCTWVSKGCFKRLKCCRNKNCHYRGKKVAVLRKFTKLRTVCKASSTCETCCSFKYSCTQYGSQAPKCKKISKLGCKRRHGKKPKKAKK